MKKNFSEQFALINDMINADSDNFELYYERGYLYYLDSQDDLAKDDYKKAVELGLDATVYPYYTFSSSNTKRREFLLPEKILVVLILIMVFVAIFFESVGFLQKFIN